MSFVVKMYEFLQYVHRFLKSSGDRRGDLPGADGEGEVDFHSFHNPNLNPDSDRAKHGGHDFN